uniref:Putative ubiquitin activating domain contining protein n=1 Tax=viral metagenome TaxID=1070528 RepID=A0A6M3M3P0_9ZZZZ
MTYIVNPVQHARNWRILVVGCGGTGGYVAEGLCRLLIGSNIPLVLIDGDRVEPHNIRRQNFYPGDEGKFKSQVLAERLARQFSRGVGYCVWPYDSELVGENWGQHMHTNLVEGLIIGCVDNAPARASIANRWKLSNWWIDAGNGSSSGQILIGNTPAIEQLEAGFHQDEHAVDRLPIPSLQLPALLMPTPGPAASRGCAEAVIADDQSPVINQAMANLVIQFVYRFLTRRLTWMGAYIDLDAGSFQTVPAEPVVVARMLGVKVDTLMANRCSLGNRYSLRR